MGLLAEAHRRELSALTALEALEHLQLDRQAVAVPARDESGPLALQQGRFIDDVFEDFVEGVPHMQGPVGVGGAVMEGEALAGVLLAEALIELKLRPEGLDLRLAHLGVRPHREGRLQQVERVLVGGRGRRAGGHGAGGQQGPIIPPG